MSTADVLININQPDVELSPAQKKFNRLTKRLKKEKARLKQLTEMLDTLSQRYSLEITPRVQSYHEHKKRMLFLLDEASGHKKLTKIQQEKLDGTMFSLAEDLSEVLDDERVMEIYTRYLSDEDDEVHQDKAQLLQSEMEDFFGIDMGEDFNVNVDDPFEKIQQLLEDKVEFLEKKRKPRKKSKKTLEKEQREHEEAQAVSLSIRQIYRSLAKELHPDRARDDQERATKHALMQRVNEAYKKKDLLRLLELQIEHEQICQDHINELAETKLNHYNKVLVDQVKELGREVDAQRQQLFFQFNVPYHYLSKPKKIDGLLNSQIMELDFMIKYIQDDLENFKDIMALKKFLNGRISR